MFSTRQGCAYLLAVVFGLATAGQALAAAVTWDGDTNGQWATPTNWVGNIGPTPGKDDLHFAGNVNTATTNTFPVSSQFNGITFDAGAGAFTAGGASMILGGNIVNNSTSAESLSLPIVLGGLTATANNGSSRITTSTGAGNLTISGLSRTPLSGQAAIFTTTGGTINTSLTNDSTGFLGTWATIGNDWAASSGGNIAAYAGYNAIAGAPAIPLAGATTNYKWSGSTGNATTLAGITEMNSLVYTDATSRTLTVASGSTLRVGPQGGFFKTDGTTNTALTIGAAGSILTAGGPTANTAGELILNANATTPDLNGIIVASTINNNGTGPVTLVKTGSAAAQLNAANSYSGGTYIQSGRLRPNVAGALGTGPVYVASGAQLYLQAGTSTNNIFVGGKGFSEGSPVFNGGAMRLQAAGVTASGTVTLTSDARITCRNAAGAGALITGQITGNYGIDFSAAQTTVVVGSLTLSNSANNWTGDTTIYNGQFIVGGTGEVFPNGAGKGNLIINGTDPTLPVAVANRAMLNLNARTETVNGLNSGGDLTLVFVTNGTAGTGTLRMGDNNAAGDFGGVIENGAASPTTMITAIEKIGGGTQILRGENTYTGTTTVTSGTLSLQNPSSSNSIAQSPAINVGPSGTLSVGGLSGGGIQLSTAAPLTNNGIVTGDVTNFGGVVKGTGTYSGTVTIGGGTLAPGASIGTMTVNNLTMGGGTWQVEMGGTNADRINATNATFTGGDITVVPTTAPTGTSYTILSASSSLTGAPTGITNPTIGRMSFSLDFSTPKTIKLNQTGAAATLTWNNLGGTGDGTTWDDQVNQNWRNGASPDKFFQGDLVTFNDTNNGHYNVVTSGTVSPLSMTVNNSSGDYTIDSSSGSISGFGGLTKTGSRKLTLIGTNSFGGAVNVNQGTVSISDGGSLGDASVSNVLTVAGGTLQATGTTDLGATRSMAIGTGGATIEVTDANSLTISGTVSGAAGNSLTKTGTGTLTLSGGNTFGGAVAINNGALRVASGSAAGTGAISANTGTTLVIVGGASPANAVTLAGGTTFGASASTNPTGNFTVTGATTIRMADPQNLPAAPVDVSEINLTGDLNGSGNISVLSNDQDNSPDGGNGFRLRGINASTYSGVITLGNNVKGEVQTAVTGPFSPAGTGKIRLTAGDASLGAALTTVTTTGGYSELNVRNNSGGNTEFGNDVEIVGSGLVVLNPLGSAPAGTTITMGNLKVGAGQEVGVYLGAEPNHPVIFKTVSLTGGAATFSPKINGFGAATAAGSDLVLGDVSESSASSITMAGLRTLYLQGAGGYSGTTTITTGTLQVGGIAAGGTTGGALGGGAVTNNATLSFNRSNAYSASNAISGTGAVQNLGSGVVTLTGANTYAGTTTVSGGTLRVNNSHIGGGNYTVNTGGALGGTGTITPSSAASIAVASGGSVAPGASVGTLTINGVDAAGPVLTLASGGTLSFELGAANTADRIALTNAAAGDVVFNANAINFTDLTANALSGDYTLFTSTVAGTYSGLTVDGGNVITAGLSIGTGLGSYTSKTLKLSGNNIILSISGVAILAGDYNNNGRVDAADYVVWRENNGTNNVLPNDPNGGTIGQNQYNTWKANFGNSGPGSGIGSNGAVPEPTSVALAILAIAALASARRNRSLA